MPCTAGKAAILISRRSVRGESFIELSEEEKQCLEKTIYQEEYDIKDMGK